MRPVLCGTWGCDLCGVRRAGWLKENIGVAQQRDGLAYFWTLTCWTQGCTPQQSFPLVKRAWNRLRTDLARRYGHFRFTWTVEPTKQGYAHLHLLTDLGASRGEISRRWEECTGGSFVVQVEPVTTSRAADYLAKYCTQQARLRREPGWEHLKYSRVFSRSRDVAFTPFKQPGEGWAVAPYAYWDAARAVRESMPVLEEQVAGCPKVVAQDVGDLDEVPGYLLRRARGAAEGARGARLAAAGGVEGGAVVALGCG